MNRNRLLDSLVLHEEFRADPYRDTKGLWTWLIGRCVETNPLSGSEWKSLLDAGLIEVKGTIAAGRYLAGLEIDKATRDLANFFHGWLGISDIRQNVMIEMRYQIAGFPTGFPRFCEAVEEEDWGKAADEGLDSKWAKEDSPRRAQILMAMLRTDTWVTE